MDRPRYDLNEDSLYKFFYNFQIQIYIIYSGQTPLRYAYAEVVTKRNTPTLHSTRTATRTLLRSELRRNKNFGKRFESRGAIIPTEGRRRL